MFFGNFDFSSKIGNGVWMKGSVYLHLRYVFLVHNHIDLKPVYFYSKLLYSSQIITEQVYVPTVVPLSELSSSCS